MTTWTDYDGSDEQIAEMEKAATTGNGWIGRFSDNTETTIIPYVIPGDYFETYGKITHYWIIPDDSLREMKIRQAQTGQPVWIRLKGYEAFPVNLYYHYWWDGEYSIVVTTDPDWNIPNAEYSFRPFEE